MNEFQIISRFFKGQQKVPGSVLLGIGDDGAKVKFPSRFCSGSAEFQESLVIVADTLVEQVHFFPDVNPYDLAYKALAVNLSDLAAMGAKPLWFTLCLTLPTSNEAWLESFAKGLFKLADEHEIFLLGGDTTLGPLSVTVQAMGSVAAGHRMERDQAKLGDDIWVTGTLGDAAFALMLRKLQKLDNRFRKLDIYLDRPVPRCKFGSAVAEYANAAIDISDGFSQDLNHICAASQLGAQVFLEQIPLSSASLNLLDELPGCFKADCKVVSNITKADERFDEVSVSTEQMLNYALTGGDDYELCFTADVRFRDVIEQLGNLYELSLSRVGVMSDSFFGVKFFGENGDERQDLQGGFTHFSEKNT